jgi:hypothetical protein
MYLPYIRELVVKSTPSKFAKKAAKIAAEKVAHSLFRVRKIIDQQFSQEYGL